MAMDIVMEDKHNEGLHGQQHLYSHIYHQLALSYNNFQIFEFSARDFEPGQVLYSPAFIFDECEW